MIEPSRADHFDTTNPKIQQQQQKTRKSKFQKSLQKNEVGKNTNLDDRQVLALQIEALQSQLEEQTRLAKDQISALKDDQKITREEALSSRGRDEIKIQHLTDNMRKIQNLLTDSTKDFLKLKSEQRSHERSYMAEKDQLCLELDELRDRLAGKHNYNPDCRNGPSAADRRSSRAVSGGKGASHSC